MNIVLTGSIGNIGKPLTHLLVNNGHSVTVISSRAERIDAIEALGAKAAIGSFNDIDFLTATFRSADVVYLMEAWEGIGSIMDQNMDFPAAFRQIVSNYKMAVAQSGVERIIHLSSVGAHSGDAPGSLLVHYQAEQSLLELPEKVAIKFIRPVSFYTNLFRNIASIANQGAIVQAYGGDRKEPWVSPSDIAILIANEMEKPFDGRSIHYAASDEVSPNEVADMIGNAIGKPELKWLIIPGEQMLENLLKAGVNGWIAQGLVDMQTAQGNGRLYEDFYKHKPQFGKEKFTDFAPAFAEYYLKKSN